MFKHIIGQSIFQIIVVMVLTFAGETFIPEYVGLIDKEEFAGHPEYKFRNGIIEGGTVRSGRMNFINGDVDYEDIYKKFRVYSRHFTFIFNCFVMMQIFNFLNCRKLHE